MFTKLEKELLYKLLGLIVSAICEHSEIFSERTRVIIVSAMNRLLTEGKRGQSMNGEYYFLFVFHVPERIFSLYFRPIDIRVNIYYNWMISTCTAEIEIVSDRDILWRSSKIIPLPTGKENDDDL